MRREDGSLRPPIFLKPFPFRCRFWASLAIQGAVQPLTRGEKTGNLERSPKDSRGEIGAWSQIRDQCCKRAILGHRHPEATFLRAERRFSTLRTLSSERVP